MSAVCSANVGSHRKLLYIVVLALILRIIFPLVLLALTHDLGVFHNNDTAEYVEPAKSLLNSGQFTSHGVPETERTPGYALLFIPGLIMHHIEATVIPLQIILSCLAIVLVYGIAQLLYDREDIALLCAALYAVEPVSIIYVAYLYSETLYIVVLLGFVYFLTRYFKTGLARDIVAAGAVLGVSTYVRPISYFLPLVVAFSGSVWVLLTARAHRGALRKLLLLFVVSMAVMVPWQARNGLETGYFGFSSISDQNLYFSIGGGILADKAGITLAEQQERMGYSSPEEYLALHPEQRTWSAPAVYRYKAQQGIRLILDNPTTYIRLVVAKVFETLHETGIGELVLLVEGGQTAPRGRLIPLVLKVLTLGLLLCYWALALTGIVRGPWRYEGVVVILLAVSAYLILAPALCIVGYSRFRHPVMPILSLMAGGGLWVILNSFKIASFRRTDSDPLPETRDETPSN